MPVKVEGSTYYVCVGMQHTSAHACVCLAHYVQSVKWNIKGIHIRKINQVPQN